jgi:hypothetical protein
MNFKKCLDEVVNQSSIDPIEAPMKDLVKPEVLRTPMTRRKKIFTLAGVLAALVLAVAATAAISILTIGQSHRALITHYFQAIEQADGEAMESILIVFHEEREAFVAWFEQAATTGDIAIDPDALGIFLDEHLPMFERFLAADTIAFLPLRSRRLGRLDARVWVLTVTRSEQVRHYDVLQFWLVDEYIARDPLQFWRVFQRSQRRVFGRNPIPSPHQSQS